jgi:hypothetical protein
LAWFVDFYLLLTLAVLLGWLLWFVAMVGSWLCRPKGVGGGWLLHQG